MPAGLSPGFGSFTRVALPVKAAHRLVVLALVLGTAACDDDDGTCEGGEPCECNNYDECFLECHDSGCDFRVHDLVHGGGVCEDNCHQLCFAVTDCSLACGQGCTSEVHDVTSSGTLCAGGCDHECFDLDRCGVVAGAQSQVKCHNATTCEIEVGPDSSVECHSVSTCRVECAGACHVEHTGVSGSPQVSCPSGAPRTECSSTRVACGAC